MRCKTALKKIPIQAVRRSLSDPYPSTCRSLWIGRLGVCLSHLRWKYVNLIIWKGHVGDGAGRAGRGATWAFQITSYVKVFVDWQMVRHEVK